MLFLLSIVLVLICCETPKVPGDKFSVVIEEKKYEVEFLLNEDNQTFFTMTREDGVAFRSVIEMEGISKEVKYALERENDEEDKEENVYIKDFTVSYWNLTISFDLFISHPATSTVTQKSIILNRILEELGKSHGTYMYDESFKEKIEISYQEGVVWATAFDTYDYKFRIIYDSSRDQQVFEATAKYEKHWNQREEKYTFSGNVDQWENDKNTENGWNVRLHVLRGESYGWDEDSGGGGEWDEEHDFVVIAKLTNETLEWPFTDWGRNSRIKRIY